MHIVRRLACAAGVGLGGMAFAGPLPPLPAGGIYDPIAYGATCDGTGVGDTAGIQAAIDDCQARGVLAGNVYGVVAFPVGQCRVTQVILKKSCPTICSGHPRVSCQVLWDGPEDAGPLMKQLGPPVPFNSSSGIIAGLNLALGIHRPHDCLDTGSGPVDQNFTVENMVFGGCLGAGIRMPGGYINAHFGKLRFDNVAGYGIDITIYTGTNLGSFSMDNFTYALNDLGYVGKAAFFVDNSVNASNIGPFSVTNGRLEIDPGNAQENWSVVRLKKSSPGNPQTLGVSVENLAVDDASGNSNDSLYYVDSAAPTSTECILAENIQMGGLDKILAGNFNAGGNTQNNIARPADGKLLKVIHCLGAGIANNVSVFPLRLSPTATAHQALTVFNELETQSRFSVMGNGDLKWSSGSAPSEVLLSRSAASTLKAPQRFLPSVLQLRPIVYASLPTLTSVPPLAIDDVAVVKDCATAACLTGGGSILQMVQWNGASWRAMGQ